ncbi:MAG: bile acid:sodium symporter family protein, partial [Candidatus Paceibacterota bacterium]
MNTFYKSLLVISLLCFLSVCVLLLIGHKSYLGPLVISMFVSLALGVRGTNTLFKSFAFSIWIFASVSLAMFFPNLVTDVRGYNTAVLIVPLIQLIMFGMGTQLSLMDFAGVLKKPKGVLVGIVCQFT